MTHDEIEFLFSYHPPTKTTKPTHATINKGMTTCQDEVTEALHKLIMGQDLKTTFEQVTTAIKTFAHVVNDNAPDSADKSAAIRCLRLARMAANQAAITIHNETTADNPNPGNEAAYMELAGAFEQQLLFTCYQANAAVAIEAHKPE